MNTAQQSLLPMTSCFEGGQLRIWEYSHVVKIKSEKKKKKPTMMIYQIEETDKETDILIRMKRRKI